VSMPRDDSFCLRRGRRSERGRAPTTKAGSTLAEGHPNGLGVDAGEERCILSDDDVTAVYVT